MTPSPSLLEAISARLGYPLGFEGTASGGCISEVFSARAGSERVFVKSGPADRLAMFEAEADGLAALAEAGTHRIPAVLALGATEGGAFLVLEWLELRPISDRAEAIAAGQALAHLHRHTGKHFGWQRDNFIGATAQGNEPSESWAQFFARRRLKPQVDLARRNGHPKELIADGERLVELVPALLLEHRPEPSLVHGDLWSGNAAMAQGRPALFDPAVHYGDREVDLAMSELFGGFPESFYAAYREAWPLPPGFEARKTLYNLYHILNHLNLFGASYLGQARRMISRLLADARGRSG
ncbi:MAG: fructosamine kinase family protein [Rhodocyclaceae bacterium]|nr:fructosamine kinase family protein [Rhodocyclaceae bacterium]